MIPKIIHYCWLSGDPYPENIKRCIDSWKKYLPDYEFILWDTHRFELEQSIWVKQAFESKKYAFAADFIRLYALYEYGGIYLDTDVEVYRSFDNLLHLPYFIGLDSQMSVEAAIIGTNSHSNWIKACLSYYDNRVFTTNKGVNDLTTLPVIMKTTLLQTKQFIYLTPENCFNWKDNNDVIYLFPYDFFCSKRHDNGNIEITSNTYTTHHFAMSWLPKEVQKITLFKQYLVRVFGNKTVDAVINLLHLKTIKEKYIK